MNGADSAADRSARRETDGITEAADEEAIEPGVFMTATLAQAAGHHRAPNDDDSDDSRFVRDGGSPEGLASRQPAALGPSSIDHEASSGHFPHGSREVTPGLSHRS